MNRRGLFGALVGGIAAATGVRALAGSRVTMFKTASVGKTELLLSPFGPDLHVLSLDAPVDPQEFAYWRDRERWSGAPVAPQLAQGHAGDLHPLQEALPQDGIVGEVPGVRDVELVLGGVDDLAREAGPLQHHADDHLQGQDLPAEKGPFLDRITVHHTLPSLSDPVNAPDRDAVPAGDLPTIWPGWSADITATVSLPPLAQVERLVDLFGASGDGAPAFAAALIGELVLTRMRLVVADPKTLWGHEVLS